MGAGSARGCRHPSAHCACLPGGGSALPIPLPAPRGAGCHTAAAAPRRSKGFGGSCVPPCLLPLLQLRTSGSIFAQLTPAHRRAVGGLGGLEPDPRIPLPRGSTDPTAGWDVQGGGAAEGGFAPHAPAEPCSGSQAVGPCVKVELQRRFPAMAGRWTKHSSAPSGAARSWAGAKRLSRSCTAGGL